MKKDPNHKENNSKELQATFIHDSQTHIERNYSSKHLNPLPLMKFKFKLKLYKPTYIVYFKTSSK
ncbi:hypothetical protein DERF_014228 [Dermatophagoides farinae]|uniref:Uncharacterized protein n=1 Tax=Dermatophagoides farinae TaxID=6954 RepID=A0A922HLQ3_DERFA|nr:hypothetical protein DERF_014228 [Dermatophagoides farinae]